MKRPLLVPPLRQAPPVPPLRALQRLPEDPRLNEYLTKRETAQTVPPRWALATHPEIPDTLQAKPAARSGEARLQRARLLGHRLV